MFTNTFQMLCIELHVAEVAHKQTSQRSELKATSKLTVAVIRQTRVSP